MLRGVLDKGKGIVELAGGGFAFDTASEVLADPVRIVGERPFRKLGDPSAVFSLMDGHCSGRLAFDDLSAITDCKTKINS